MSEQKSRKQVRMTMAEYRTLQAKGIGKKRGVMNKLETHFAQECLEPMRLDGVISSYQYEAIKLKLATGAYYTPDFVAFDALGKEVCFYEVKGFIREASLVRIKVAAENFPQFQFWMVFWDKQKGWVYREF